MPDLGSGEVSGAIFTVSFNTRVAQGALRDDRHAFQVPVGVLALGTPHPGRCRATRRRLAPSRPPSSRRRSPGGPSCSPPTAWLPLCHSRLLHARPRSRRRRPSPGGRRTPWPSGSASCFAMDLVPKFADQGCESGARALVEEIILARGGTLLLLGRGTPPTVVPAPLCPDLIGHPCPSPSFPPLAGSGEKEGWRPGTLGPRKISARALSTPLGSSPSTLPAAVKAGAPSVGRSGAFARGPWLDPP